MRRNSVFGVTPAYRFPLPSAGSSNIGSLILLLNADNEPISRLAPLIPDLLVGAAAKYYHILGRVAKHLTTHCVTISPNPIGLFITRFLR